VLLAGSAMIYSACGDDAADSGGPSAGASGNAGASGFVGEAPSGAGGEIAHAGTGTTGGSESGGAQGGAPQSSGGETAGGSEGSAAAGTSAGGSATAGTSAGGSATAGTSTTGGTADGGSAGAGTAGDASGGVAGEGGSESVGGFGGATGGAAGGTGEGGTGAGGGASFCASLGPLPAGVSARQCFDFGASNDAALFTPDAGVWSVADGRYQGIGPEEAASCKADGTWMSGSIFPGLSAADVRVRAELTGVDRPDKVVIVRSAGSSDRIELNFRANFVSGGTTLGGDLIVQQLVDCVGAFRIPEAQVPIPHAVTDTLDVEVELRGQSLLVRVDGEVVLDTVFTTPNLLRSGAGNVGVGVFIGGTVRFDNLVIEALE
jgi:hypothetical protein